MTVTETAYTTTATARDRADAAWTVLMLLVIIGLFAMVARVEQATAPAADWSPEHMSAVADGEAAP